MCRLWEFMGGAGAPLSVPEHLPGGGSCRSAHHRPGLPISSRLLYLIVTIWSVFLQVLLFSGPLLCQALSWVLGIQGEEETRPVKHTPQWGRRIHERRCWVRVLSGAE